MLREIRDYWWECPISEEKKMITRILIAAVLVLSCGSCLAQKIPENKWVKFLTVEQAAELVAEYNKAGTTPLPLWGLTSINKDVARELAKYEGMWLTLPALTSIDKDIAKELAKYQSHEDRQAQISIDQNDDQRLSGFIKTLQVRRETVSYKGAFKGALMLEGLTSINEDVARELAKYKGRNLEFNLPSINEDVARELAKFEGEYLQIGKPAFFDKDVAKELAKFQGSDGFFYPR